MESGLAEESRFLSHWFGLSKIGEEGAAKEQLPRPSPWNYFAKDLSSPKVESSTSGFGLRAWAQESGLDEESRFLSHWFGLTSGKVALDTQLPRPSPWNHFAKAKAIVDGETEETPEDEAELRSWAKESGLPSTSRFLSHWFGLSKLGEEATKEQLPRPSPWNYFAKEEALIDQELDEEQPGTEAAAFELRAWSYDAGLEDDSQFLNHWFGLKNCRTNAFVDSYGMPFSDASWVRSKDGASVPTMQVYA